MTTINNLGTIQSISAGDQLVVFVTDQQTTFKISVNTLLNFISANFPSAGLQADLGSLPRQINPSIAPVAPGLAYISASGFVVIAQ